MAHFPRDFRGVREIWNFGEFSGVSIPMVFKLGNRMGGVWADVDRDVTSSKSLLRHSVPKIGSWTWGTTARQVISRRIPRLSERVPPVG